MSDHKGIKNTEGFLKYLARSVPVVDPSPYFAARVARIAMERNDSLAYFFLKMGRWLIPSTLAVCTFAWILILQGPLNTRDPLYETEFLFEPEYSSVEITYETVMGFNPVNLEKEDIFENTD